MDNSAHYRLRHIGPVSLGKYGSIFAGISAIIGWGLSFAVMTWFRKSFIGAFYPEFSGLYRGGGVDSMASLLAQVVISLIVGFVMYALIALLYNLLENKVTPIRFTLVKK